MERRIIASGLAATAGVTIVAAQAIAWFSAAPSWREVLPAAGALLIASALPLLGAFLVARRRPGGVAVLVAAALVGLPAVLRLSSFLAVSRPTEGVAILTLYLVAQLSIVAAGAAAWGLRDPDRWLWNRPIPAPFVALGIVALAPDVALLVTMNGLLFPLAMLADLNLLDLASLMHLGVAIGLLAWAARLPRRTAAVMVLVLMAPRLYESIAMLWRGPGLGGFATDPLSWLVVAAEAALTGTACWWLTRGDGLSTRNEVVDPEAHVLR